MNTYEYVRVYLDTSGILKKENITQNTNKEARIVLNKIYRLSQENKLSIHTMQGSFSDIFGGNYEKIFSDAQEKAAISRDTIRMDRTSWLATKIKESDSDFESIEIRIFEAMFEENPISIYDSYCKLKSDDKNDYNIICDVIFAANYASFFLTLDARGFIRNLKREKLETIAKSDSKVLKIREINYEVLKEIEQSIEEYKEYI